MSRTFHQLTGNGSDFTTSDPYIASSPVGYQDFEWARQAIDLLAYLGGGFDLGGDERGILSASYVTVNGGRAWSLDGGNLGGLTLEAVVWYYTTDVTTSVQVRIRNTTDSSNAGAGTLSTSTTKVKEVITLTLAAGVKDYELQVTGGDALNGVMAWGVLRLRRVPV